MGLVNKFVWLKWQNFIGTRPCSSLPKKKKAAREAAVRNEARVSLKL